MAKARKGKNEEQQKADNSEAVVKHQKLCLSIDMEKRRIYGYTVLEIVIPENGIVGLHADNLAIESVTVDGEPAEFEVFPHYVNLDSGDRWCSVSTATSAADAAGSVYLSSLERELVPNLLIMCNKCCKSDTEQQEMEVDNGLQPQDEVKQNVRMVRIEYWVEKAETGIHFDGNVLHTDNQMRRSRCWFPCMDENLQYCCYDLEFTVAHNLVAVSTGTLLYQMLEELQSLVNGIASLSRDKQLQDWRWQVLSSDDPPRKTYVYQLSIPVAARWISLTVAPFEILSDRHNGMLSHICLPSNLSKLQNTVGFFHSAFSHYEEYLCASFPFGSYSQVFIAPEMAISSLSLGASMCIFSSQLLFDEKVIDQTINTRIKLAYALARQWFGVYITPEAPNDDWLLDGLAEFLTDSFIKRSLGNNEARYRRYKANSAVCKADDSGATVLSSSASYKDLYGTQCIGFYGKIRSWKSVAVLQMLEKQMGPESFRKILQTILLRAQDASRSLRTLSTKEFRHFANKIGNLERPFLKEFFPRWVESSGCPVLKMGFSYNKRKNMVEMAVIRGCTATPDTVAAISNGNLNSEKREGDVGWPGMMSIRVHELDGMYDHPILPLAGDSWQLLEIQCHAKLAARRVQKPRKSSRPDGSDDNGEPTPALDTRSNSDSPLLWLRADPEMEYLAEIHFNQPVQMWINQLEKDKDVVAQVQAIAMLEALPQHTFSVINALNSFLTDSKAFWRIRVEAAFALAKTASEETDWAGLFHLIKFYKSRRFDTNIGLPKPNDFRDFQEYFVLEVIPLAIATVRTTDKRSPREAVEFILQLLKYNDNNGNPYSDVFWLAALVESVGELEFGLQNITYLSSLLKRLDRLLQFDRLMPSYNGILTISCIRSLTQIALKLSAYFPLDRVVNLIKQFHAHNVMLQVKVEAGRALLDLEFQSKGIDAALTLFIKYLKDESSLRGQVKLGVHALRLCQIKSGSNSGDDVKSETLVALLHLLESPVSFNNVILRHYLFSILQVLAGRIPTLYGVPRDETLRMGHAETCTELKNIFAALVKHSKPPEHALDQLGTVQEDGTVIPEAVQREHVLDTHVGIPGAGVVLPDGLVISEAQEKRDALANILQQPDLVAQEKRDALANILQQPDLVAQKKRDALANILQQPDLVEQLADTNKVLPEASKGIEANLESRGHSEAVADQSNENVIIAEASNKSLAPSNCNDKMKLVIDKPMLPDNSSVPEASKELDTVSNGQERKKPVVRIKVKRSAASSRAEDPDNVTAGKSHEGHTNVDHGASSSVSVDAPQRNFPVTLSAATHNLHNLEEANSYHEGVSRVTASIGSVKFCADGDELPKELQCTADSSKVSQVERIESTADEDNSDMVATKYASLQSLSVTGSHVAIGSQVKVRKKNKDVDKKRKRDGHKSNRDDPEYKEKKRLKKEKKRKEKELAKNMKEEEVKVSASSELQNMLGKLKGEVAGSGGEGKLGSVDYRQRTEEIKPRAAGNTGEGNVPSGEVPGCATNVQENAGETSGTKVVIKRSGNVDAAQPSSSSNKLRIKLKSRTLDKH